MGEQVLNKSISFLKNNVTDYFSSSHDCIGIAIIHIINQNYKQQLNSKNVRNIDYFFEEITESLKNRFIQVMNLHIDSLRSAIPMLIGSIESRTPYYITRRYAEFCTSLLYLKKDYENFLKSYDLDNFLKTLRVEMLSLLERMGSTLGSEKKQLFLINNYALICTLMKAPEINSPEADYIERLFEVETDRYAENLLTKHFSKLLTFVRANSVKDQTGKINPQQPKSNAEHQTKLETIVEVQRSLTDNNNWKENFVKINKGIMETFPNFITGTNIFMKLKNNFYVHYGVFHDIISAYYKELKNNQYYLNPSDIRYVLKDL